ncbi:malectin domain-containing carbohydrate-binding protein [Robiginitalea biformata]|uniref:malectin domain-containing carbohydrate-binding protein n=1 Tax=Robiginitalea biformata TaxID=252307 RepID=UPI003B5AFCE5
MENVVKLRQRLARVIKNMAQRPPRTQTVPAKIQSIPAWNRKAPTFWLFILALVGLGFLSPVRSQADLVVNPASSDVEVSDTFTLTVAIESSGQAYQGAAFYLQFDPAILQVNSATQSSGSALPIPLDGPDINNTSGTVYYQAGNLSSAPTTGTNVLDIVFEAVAEGQSTIAFFDPDPSDPSLFPTISLSGGSVLGTATGAVVNVGTANQNPIADFTIAPNPANTNQVIDFTSTSTDADGSIVNYSWNFGDGSPVVSGATETAPQHSYTLSGTYQVMLTVTDDLGGVGMITKQVQILETGPTQYTITASAGAGGSISPSGAVAVNEGDNQEFVFTPDPGFEITEILVDSSPVPVAPTYQFTGVTANATISVSFAEIPPFQLCIAAGNDALTAFGRDFVGDPNTTPPTTTLFSRTNGKAYKGYSSAIAGTTPGSPEELLFQKEIYGGAGGTNPSYIYDIPVENGNYQVELYFAEVFHPGPNGRVFDVFLDGNLILDEYDLVNPIKDGLSSNQTAITRTYNVNVTDGNISVQIGDATIDNGKLAGICITEVSSANLHPLSNIGPIAVDATVPVALALGISDPESDPLTVTLHGLPASLSFNFTTQQLEGTPLVGDVGTYTINAIISDGTNSPVTEEFTLTVNPAPGNDPPTIDAIADVTANEGDNISVPITITDDTDPSGSIEIFDVSAGGTNQPFTPTTAVAVGSLTDNGGGSYSFDWTPAPGSGKSYLAIVTADDGVNPPVSESFRIDVAQQLQDGSTILARTFNNPDPWYGGSPQAPYTVAIETTTAQNIGWIDNGEFVEYLINVPTPGVFDMVVQAAKGSGGTTTVTFSENSGGSFIPIGSVDVVQTAWQTYASYTTQVTFVNSGLQTLRLDFNGGVNISEFSFTANNDNTPPVVTITSPVDGIYATSDVSLSFTGTANDLADGDLSANLSWESDVDGPLGTGASFSSSLSLGTHVITASVTDLDGSDPQTGQASITVNIISPAPACDVSFRVNAGGPTVLSPEGDFEADQSVSQAGSDAQTGTPSPYLDLTPPAVDKTFGSNAPLASNTTGYPDFLFQTERWSDAASPDNMNWAFPTGNGTFLVKLLFNENWSGEVNSPRVFDVIVEGELALDDYRPSGPTGADFNVAKVETYEVTVEDGTLNINFLPGTQNPSIKGFDICAVPAPNTAPVVNITAPAAGANVTRGQAITLTATATDAEDGDVAASIQWSSGDIQFSPDGTGGSTTGVFVTPGTQTLRATAQDSEPLEGFDEITVNVSAPEVTFASPLEGATLSSLTVGVELSPTGILFGNSEHFHIYINPPDINNIDTDTRISSAGTGPWKISETEFEFDENSGSLTATTPGNGIQEGANTIVVVAANQFHDEFTNPEAKAVVNFDVCLVNITDVAATDPSECGVNDGSIVITADGSNLQYSIDNGATFVASNTFSDLPAGTYNIVVKNSETCSDTQLNVVLTAPDVPAISQVDPTNPTDCGTEDGTLTVSATGTNLEYSLDGVDFQASNVFSDLAAGAYTVTVREVGTTTCTATSGVVTLTAPEAPSIDSITPTDPTACTTDDGTITIGATGTQLEYSIDGGANFFENGGNFTGLPDGTYNIVVREVNSPACLVNGAAPVVLSDPIGPMPVISGDLTYLQGTSGTTLDAGAGYSSYLWSTGETSQTILATAGSYFVTVTDANGCEGTSVTVIVSETTDNEAPNAVCTAFEIFLDADGNATLDPADIDGGSTDNVGIASLSASQTAFTCADLGVNQVMLTVVDVNGLSSSCMADVTVTDLIAPVVDCDANVIRNSLNGNPVVISVPEPTVTDNCETGLVAVGTRNDGQPMDAGFPVGTTVVTWTIADASGNVGTCQTNVIVNNTGSTNNNIVSFNVGGQVGNSNIDATLHTVEFTMPFGTDLSSLAPSIAVSEFASINPASGATADFTSPVDYTVTAQSGAQQVWQVTALLAADSEDPVVACPPNLTITNDPGACGAIVTFAATATDNDAVSSLDYSTPSGSVFPVGTTTVTVTAYDPAGNSDTCTFDVTVNDTEAPAVTCPGDIIVQAAPGASSATVSYGLPTVTDNCPGANVSLTGGLSSGAAFPIGTTTVTYQATDASGNTASCSFDVTVEETPVTASLVIAPASMNVNLNVGGSQAVQYTVDSDDGSTLPTPAAMTITDNATGLDATWASTTSAANQDTPYEVFFNAAGLAPGTYNGTLAAGPVTGYSDTSIPITMTVSEIPPLSLLEFVLVDADSDTDLFPITNGMLIDVNALPTNNLNIRAEASDDVSSVVFQLSGTLTKNQTENVSPYAVYGDNSGNYNAQVFPLGSYTLNGTAYSGAGGSGSSGTTATVQFTFTDENPACASFDAVLDASSDPTSCSSPNGTASIDVSGATGSVTYTWSHNPALNSATATGLSGGSYSVQVSDSNGCIDVVNFTLNAPASPVVTLAAQPTVLNTDAPFALTGGSPAGGTYSGTGVSGGVFDPAVGPGTFAITYTFTDGNGCTASATQNLQVNSAIGDAALIVLDATTDTPLFALTDGMTIYKSNIGNTPLGVIYNADLNPGGVQFNLSGPLNESRYEGPSPHSLFGDIGVNIQGKPFPVGNYTLVANPANGPTISVNFSVVDQDPACVSFDASLASTTNPSTCNGNDGSATVSVSGSTGTVTYLWSHNPGLNAATANNLAPGAYSVTVSDSNGCIDVVSFTLNGPPLPVVTLAPQPTVEVTDAPFALSGGSPAGGTYSGTGVSGGVFDPSVGPGTYVITYSYTDGNGCSASATRNLTVSGGLDDAVLIVVDATTDTPLFELVNGMIIQKSAIGNTPLSVIYNASLNPNGVFFKLTGPINETRSEGAIAPHSLFGDIGVDIQGKPFPVGNYSLTANPNNGPTVVVNFSVVNTSTSKVAPSVKSSPNPADEEVTLTFDAPVRLETFHIYDTAGRLVRVVRAEGDADLRAYRLEVLDLPVGMYYVRSTDADGNSYQEPILINRY